ncbi:MAG: hypothetical protein U9R74_18355 [Pseudomonadota bacterium]|nr:hypothetical protein [Pseudomonadota bacterium]
MKLIPLTITTLLFTTLTGLLVPVAGTAQQPAATVQSLSGTCMLNRGEAAETLTLGTPLNAGDTVTCTEGSDATIVYNNDCAVSMPAESQLTIGARNEPCEVLAAALVIPGAAAAIAATDVTLALAAGFAVVPIVAVIDTVVKNNSEDKMSGE